jgi:hypothetical protein
MVGEQMLIGYSFWGFLGPGITDTPDGGRSHRRVLLEGLRAQGHELVLLQHDRDRDEAGTDLTDSFRWQGGFPDIDVLFLEWRWPIPGRNTTPCGTPGHTCDLHRQQQLLDHYTHMRRVPTIVWDKDLHLPLTDPLRRIPQVSVCEAALHPRAGATSLLFPVADHILDTADAAVLASRDRATSLVYVGNQYDRDHAFDTYFAPAARRWPHTVAGKWTHTRPWPDILFIGRVPFAAVAHLHSTALATVLLLPDRYAAVGQMTQRLPEAVLQGCLPLTPSAIRAAERFTPPRLHVRDGGHVCALLDTLTRLAGTPAHAELITQCLTRLGLFRLSRQLDVLDTLLRHPGRVG